MIVLPPHHPLQDAVQPGQCRVTGDLYPTPDWRFTPLQGDFDLIDDWRYCSFGPRHLGPAGAFAQEYTVTRNAFSDNQLYGYGKTSQCHRLDSDCTVK